MAKIYLWDWSQIENNEGAKFENMIASHLLKFCHFLIDTEGLRASLYYLRDIEKRGVDFMENGIRVISASQFLSAFV